MKNGCVTMWLALFCCLFGSMERGLAKGPDGYAVIASLEVQADGEWNGVVRALARKHGAEVLYYRESPSELLEGLRKLRPRYLAVVEKPGRISREFVMEGHRMSRRLDDDIYADCLWGIITGYTARDAMRMVEDSSRPFVVRTALNTTSALSDGSHFDRFAYLDDGGTPGSWGEKKTADGKVERHRDGKWELLSKWVEKYRELDPDLLVTSSHATEKNLEMPFSTGDLKASGGRLYADFIRPEFLEGTSHPRVYFAAGNCLIGNIGRNPESMAVAWLGGMDATAMVGYVVTTWYGRNGWGGLKFWAANAGRLTLAEALCLNQQDMLHREHGWHPKSLEVDYPFTPSGFGEREELARRYREVTGEAGKLDRDRIGHIHDRDVVVLYGDPAWKVYMQPGKPLGYEVDFRMKGKRCTVTVKTDSSFEAGRMEGDGLKEEHVGDLPFACWFPKRLVRPRLAEGQDWKVALSEDFLLVYDCGFEKDRTYRIVLDMD